MRCHSVAPRIVFDCRMVNDPAIMSSAIPCTRVWLSFNVLNAGMQSQQLLRHARNAVRQLKSGER
jgi:hypothetical protein